MKKKLREENLFIVEGEKFISEIPKNYTVRQYFFSQKFADSHDISSYKSKARCEIIRDGKFNSLADTVSPQGVLAVCEKIPRAPENILRETDFILLGESLGDPGNIGALIRTAAAAGAGGAIFTRGSCDVFSPKVIRAAAGAALRLPIIENTDAEEIFAALKNFGFNIFAAHPRGNFLPYEINFREKFALLLGNESHGISHFAKQNASALVRLPMTNDTESLNVSVAGSIFMYEAVRQRGNF
jgi:TrmH family RNA methyltransferase